MLVFNADIAAWMKKQLPENADFLQPDFCVGVYNKEGTLIAGIAFQNYMQMAGLMRAFQVELTCVARDARWATKNVISKILNFAFCQLNCQRIVTLTKSENCRAIRFNRGIGFVHEGTLRKAVNNEDVEIHGLLKEEFLAGKYYGVNT